MKDGHALVVGIAAYQSIRPLPDIVIKDAHDVYDVLTDPNTCGYLPGQTRMLLDGAATRRAILAELAALAERCNRQSTVFVYMSCHGGRVTHGVDAGDYLLPVDTDLTSSSKLDASSAISSADLTAALRAIPARKLIVVFDCCHAGGIGQAKSTADALVTAGLSEPLYQQLAAGRGRVILASSRGYELSWVRPGDNNSLFTKHLLKGLRGGAPNPGGVIRVFDLFSYVQTHVTAEYSEQHPIFKAEVEENFVVALAPQKPIAIRPMAQTTHKYDLFISYHAKSAERSWVRKQLVPALKNAGLKVCVDYRCFRLGRPLLLEMARAIEESRYTLAILSPAYLNSSFSELETVMAQHLALEEDQVRFLAAIREECTPRLGIRTSLMLDMSDDDEFAENIERLAYELSAENN